MLHGAQRETYACVLRPVRCFCLHPTKERVLPAQIKSQLPFVEITQGWHQCNARSATCAREPSSNSWTEMSVPPTTLEKNKQDATMPITCRQRRIQVVQFGLLSLFVDGVHILMCGSSSASAPFLAFVASGFNNVLTKQTGFVKAFRCVSMHGMREPNTPFFVNMLQLRRSPCGFLYLQSRTFFAFYLCVPIGISFLFVESLDNSWSQIVRGLSLINRSVHNFVHPSV